VSRWLSFNDAIAVQQLQHRGMQLDLEGALLWPHSPLRAALAGHWPWSPIGAETSILYPPARRGRALGFIQVRQRRRRPEADIVFIAPALDAREDAVSIWYRLLAECAREFGDRGVQRLFAQMVVGDGTEDVFRQAGFAAYAHEDIYFLSEQPHDIVKTRLLRHQRTRDTWNLMRLYSEVTPRPVQIAEGMAPIEGQTGKMRNWWDQARGSGYILSVGSEIAGAVRILRGSAAYWLRFWLHPQAHQQAPALLMGALSILWAAPRRPIYCSVRDYEGGMRAPLQDMGFRYLQTRSLLVKHTTVRVKEPLLSLMPALEKRAEPAASVAQRMAPHTK
jgi:hypothetical protein